MMRSMSNGYLTLTLWTCVACAACATDEAGVGGQHSPSQVSHSGPKFPGSGTSSAGQSIAAGQPVISCDGTGPLPSFGPKPDANAVVTCFFKPGGSVPAATVEWIVEAAAQGDLVHARLTLNPDFVDNTYGENAVGWLGNAKKGGKEPKPAKQPKPGKDPVSAKPDGGVPPVPGGAVGPGGPGKGGHTFRDLVGSDHAEFKLTDASGRLVLQFKADYLSESSGSPSGYGSLGVVGGEGRVLIGSASDVVAVSTSLDRNLNACGLADYTVNSPATDLAYTPNPAASRWDYRVVYDVWVRRDAFGAPGFGAATVDFVHASPSKAGSHTIEVEPRDCPPDWPYCTKPEGCCTIIDGSCVDTPPRDDEPSCEGTDCGPIGI